jgi:hypothetical protein
MLKQLFCAQKETSKSSKGREKLQTYLKSQNSARSLHKSVIQAPSQVQKNTHTREELFSHAHTHEAPRPSCGLCLYLNLLFFPSPSLSLTGLYGKGTSFGGPQMRHGLLKFEIMLFFFIKKRHPTKMKYGTYGFY